MSTSESSNRSTNPKPPVIPAMWLDQQCLKLSICQIDRRGFIGRGSADLVMNLLFDREHHGTDGPDDRRILSLGAVLNGRNVSQRSVRIEHMEAGS
jgi:hypothetical protein